MKHEEYKPLSDLLGKVIKDIYISGDKDVIFFTLEDGTEYKMYHEQDCCELVLLEDIIGDIEDLIGSPITMAEESTNSENPKKYEWGEDESFTWTFYKLATIKGYVTIRWYGTSNGYYCEKANFCKIKNEALD